MLTPKRGSASAVGRGRKIPFSRIGFALSLTIFVVAALVLYRILRDIDPDELVKALEATDWGTLVSAGCFVAAGYVTLTFYDLFALRTIGRSDVPYRVAALGGFTSYAVGPQYRRQRLLRRRRALSHLFELGPERHRRHQNLLRRRAHLLARQRHRARAWHPLYAGSGASHRSAAALAQPRLRAPAAGAARRLCVLGLGQAARDRPRGLAGEFAGRRVDACCRS